MSKAATLYRLNRATGLIVVAGVLYWWIVFLVMHVLEPEFSPFTAPGSAYVLGAYGEWMTTTYFVLSAVLLSAGLGLSRNVAAPLTRIACVAFVIAAAGAMTAGLFPMDFPPPPRTFSGRVHALGGVLTFLPWVSGTALFSVAIRRDHRWPRSATLFALSILSAGMVGVLPFSIRFGFAGAAQRLLLTLLFTWLIIVALHLIRPRLQYLGT